MSKSKGLGFAVLLILLVAPLLHAQTPLTTGAYLPLSTGEKASLFGHRVIAPSAFAKTAFTAGIDQAKNAPKEWGQGVAGYGRRFAHKYANRGMENAMARLKPYFRIRKAHGKTYFRSEKRQKQQLIDPSALN